MKLNKLVLTGIISAAALWQSAQAYTPPTDSQINKLLANPKLIVQLLGDANGKEAAALVQQVIDKIQASNMGKAQKDYLIAYYTGRVASLLNNEDAESYAKQLVADAPAEDLSTVFAGMTTGRGGSSDFVALLKELAGEDSSLLKAIQTPNITLTDPVYRLLISTLANAQSVAPAPIDSIPVPIPAGQGGGGGGGGGGGTTPPTPPVIPPTYNGQG